MGFFSGKKEQFDFSDEALLAAAEATMAAEQGQGSLPEGEVVGKAQEAQGQSGLPGNYQQVQEMLNRAYRDLAREQQSRAELEQMVRQLQSERKGAVCGNSQEDTRRLLSDPLSFLEQTSGQMVERRLQECLKPLLESMRQEEERRLFDRAMQATLRSFPQLEDSDEQSKLLQMVMERSHNWGNDSLWRKHPEDLMRLVAWELYGMNDGAGQDVIDAAAKAKEKQVVDEINARNAAKAGLAIHQKNNKSAQGDISEEEKIIQGIFAAGKSRFFD